MAEKLSKDELKLKLKQKLLMESTKRLPRFTQEYKLEKLKQKMDLSSTDKSGNVLINESGNSSTEITNN